VSERAAVLAYLHARANECMESSDPNILMAGIALRTAAQDIEAGEHIAPVAPDDAPTVPYGNDTVVVDPD
jgi:DNA polymerase II small subunit/DNA polymerase delta subunit B